MDSDHGYSSELVDLAKLTLVNLTGVTGAALQRSLDYLRRQVDESEGTSAGFQSSI